MNRKRNPYTLNGFDPNELPKRRASCTSLKSETFRDVFEHDPFKVHSYNFHYAEHPGYHLQPPFYVQPLLTRNAETQQSNFREARRRKFIQETNYNVPKPLHTNCYQNQYSNGCENRHSYFERPCYYMGATTPASHNAYVPFNDMYYSNQTNSYNCGTPCCNPRDKSPMLQHKGSSVSLCDIQIRIKRSEHRLDDNVFINIAADQNGAINSLPYRTEGLTITSTPYPSTALGRQQSTLCFGGHQSKLPVCRSHCCITSSDSSTDFDMLVKKKHERVPQFIPIQPVNKKKQEPKKTATKSKSPQRVVTPPCVFAAKTSKDTKKVLQRRVSNLTIKNNLDTQIRDCKLNLIGKNFSTSTKYQRCYDGCSPRSSSAVRTPKNSDQSPLRVNINLFEDKKLGSYF